MSMARSDQISWLHAFVQMGQRCFVYEMTWEMPDGEPRSTTGLRFIPAMSMSFGGASAQARSEPKEAYVVLSLLLLLLLLMVLL